MKYNPFRLLTLFFAVLGPITATAQHSFVVGRTEISGADTLLFQLDRLYWGEGVISSGSTPIMSMTQTLSSGSALADIRAITYEDGAPVIENGKLYLSGSTRTGGAGIAIIALTLGTGELEFTGSISSVMDGMFWKICAPHIMYDRNRKIWQVTTPCHAPFDHLLWIATAYNDLRFGVSVLDYKHLEYEKPSKGDEDCQIFYDDDMHKWVMIYASLRRPDDGSGYILRLQTSDRPDGGFKDYSYQTDVSATGVTTTLIGGKRYVLSGNMPSGNVNRYSVWSYPEMRFVCDLNIDIDDGAHRSWNNLVPVPEGESSRYVLMGFDRQATTDEDNWTYGNTYFLYSRQRNPGMEFALKDEDGNVIVEAAKEFPFQVNDLEFLRRGCRRFCFEDILLSKIDLEYDTTGPKGNMYPRIGTSDPVRFDNGCIHTVPAGNNGAVALSGIHHPFANYLMPLDGISDGESRYLYIGDKNGKCAARIIATRKYEEISITFQGSGEPVSMGKITCNQRNEDTLRIFLSQSNLTQKYFCFAFCHKGKL